MELDMAELKHLEWFSYLDEPPYLYGLEHSEGVARPIIRVMIQINTMPELFIGDAEKV